MSTILLRDATPDDALCLGVLGMQVFLDTYAPQGIRGSIATEVLEAFAPQVMARLIADPGILLMVAESNHHLLGFAQVRLNARHPLIDAVDVAELQRLYIQERFTGLGIGYQLLQAAERGAVTGGASMLWATVWERNERALGFYPRRGYGLLGNPVHTFQGESHGNRLFGKALDVTAP
ncbi:GNAT family N-acetyltransferase [Pseudomonas sp. NFPP24]|uniref:GNAT family N-acetyltransferase n=1 Tax=Pseudomonas sp. NFPP24 TaxID=1566228 RepID=UPI0008EA5A56|nr:GNAT family N-acetyltransferase [Pseudomonas sp. NFPP24]SFA90379.1 Acetyltransferase (GNAT) family protein [Pseudomonas sp. NFPP24]